MDFQILTDLEYFFDFKKWGNVASYNFASFQYFLMKFSQRLGFPLYFWVLGMELRCNDFVSSFGAEPSFKKSEINIQFLKWLLSHKKPKSENPHQISQKSQKYNGNPSCCENLIKKYSKLAELQLSTFFHYLKPWWADPPSTDVPTLAESVRYKWLWAG